MCRVIALVNQKGGVGKTTSAYNLGVALSKHGRKVLVIDADSQGSLTALMGWNDTDSIPVVLANVMNMITRDEPFERELGILHHAPSGLDLMPSNILLAELEPALINVLNREQVLRTYVDMQRPHYDYILIDCMPSLGMMTINVLTAADSCIIPMNASYLSFKGFEMLVNTIVKIRRKMNPKLAIEGVLLTMVQSRVRYVRDMSEQITRLALDNNIPFFETPIPRTVRVDEVSGTGRSVYDLGALGQKVSDAYTALAEKVMEKED